MKKRLCKSFFQYSCAIFLALCASTVLGSSAGTKPEKHGSVSHSASAKGNHSAKTEKTEIHWGYANEGKPENWGELNPDFEICKTGKVQSPINISAAVPSKMDPIEFHYEDVPLKILNNGHTIQVNYPEGSYIVLDGEKFELIQFHFHSPSENLLEDRAFHMEAHLVHKNSKGDLGVVGIFLAKGRENLLLKTLWSHLPNTIGDEVRPDQTSINVSGLLPANHSFYRFMGSLTTPPCTQNVFWNVLKTPVEVSARQIQLFNSLIGFNSRPVQPINGRVIGEVTVAPPVVSVDVDSHGPAKKLDHGTAEVHESQPAVHPASPAGHALPEVDHGKAAHLEKHSDDGHAPAAGGHGAADDGHGGGHHSAPMPTSYAIVWMLTFALASMMIFYALMTKKWRCRMYFASIRDVAKLKDLVGVKNETGQFQYRDEYFYAKIKPEGYVHNQYGVDHGSHGHDDHAGEAHAHDDHHAESHAVAHGRSAHSDYDSKDSLILAGGFVFVTLAIFFLSYSPELFKHFDVAAKAFVDGYHEPTWSGVLTFLFRFSLGVAMMVYGILSMGGEH